MACKGGATECVLRLPGRGAELVRIDSKVQDRDGLSDVDVRELAIHRRVSRLNYSRRRAEASAVKAHLERGVALAPGMEIGYVVRDAGNWRVDIERDASGFDEEYYVNFWKRRGTKLYLRL